MSLLTVDPGSDAGWARFSDNGILIACGLNTSAHVFTHDITRAVVERPHTGKTPAPLKDIITLAVRAGEWGGTIRSFVGVEPAYIEPSTWKGSLPKDVCQARIWAKLEPDERTILDKAASGIAPSKRHNMIDAVGIGLHTLGRCIK